MTYDALHVLLRPCVLHAQHRVQFLWLLSRALLCNSMLPAYVVARFCKRLCRLALSGPPSGRLFALALVSNLLRKHRECAWLVHGWGVMAEDVFVEGTDELRQTRA